MFIKSIQRILIIRRDNIGDLICTTPMVRLLRKHYPHAQIDMLVNSYNYQAVETNPDLNHVFCYTKLKHREHQVSVIKALWLRAKLLWRLRQSKYDVVLVGGLDSAGRGSRLARQLKPGMVLAQSDSLSGHAVEHLSPMLKQLGIFEEMPAAVCVPKVSLVDQYLSELPHNKQYVAVHISARKVSQRWPVEFFIELIQKICVSNNVNVLLLWSPGQQHNPLHPGDDEKAHAILAGTKDLPLIACPTTSLDKLIAIMSLSNVVICSDGGAMHVAAALAKPIVCLFGNSDAKMWHPWQVPYVLLQKHDLDVRSISVDEVFSAYIKLAQV